MNSVLKYFILNIANYFVLLKPAKKNKFSKVAIQNGRET